MSSYRQPSLFYILKNNQLIVRITQSTYIIIILLYDIVNVAASTRHGFI